MSISVEERYKGRSGSESKRSITYLVRGTDDDTTAIYHTSITTPATWDGLQLKSISVTQLADDIFATVAEYGQYKKSEPAETGSVAFEFSYAATSEHIKQSIETVGTYVATSDPVISALDYKGAINVADDGGHLRVEGVDVSVPSVTHSWTYYPVDTVVTEAYQLLVMGLMGGVNNATFKGAAAGSVRFIGCRGSVRSDSDWQIRFDFAYKANETNITRGAISGIDKKGHEILWMLYGDVLDDDGWLVKRPMVAYVEKVIEEVNLDGLGL